MFVPVLRLKGFGKRRREGAEDAWSDYYVSTYFYKDQTLGDKDLEEAEYIRKLNILKVKYYKYGREVCPTTGNNHLQVYFILQKKQRFSTVGKTLGCYICPARGTIKENDIYTEKTGNYIEWGDKPKQKGGQEKVNKELWKTILELAFENNLDEIASRFPMHYIRHRKTLMEIADEHTSWQPTGEKLCIWLYSKSYFVAGKSTFLAHHFPLDREKCYWHIMESNFWEGYRQQKVVVFDDLDTTNLEFGGFLKRITSDTPKIINKKHTSAVSRIKVIFVASNYTPKELWPNEIGKALHARFRIYNAVNHNGNDLMVREPKSRDIFPLSLCNLLRNFDLI